MRREKEGKMGCFEILYKDCFDKKCVGFGYGESKEEVIEKFPTFNGCRLILKKRITICVGEINYNILHNILSQCEK